MLNPFEIGSALYRGTNLYPDVLWSALPEELQKRLKKSKLPRSGVRGILPIAPAFWSE